MNSILSFIPLPIITGSNSTTLLSSFTELITVSVTFDKYAGFVVVQEEQKNRHVKSKAMYNFFIPVILSIFYSISSIIFDYLLVAAVMRVFTGHIWYVIILFPS